MKTTQSNQATLGYVFTFTAAACWALLAPLSRLPMSQGISPLEVAFWRAFFGALCFVTHALATRQCRVSRKDALVFVSFGVIGVALLFGSFQVAVQRTGAAMASVLMYTAPFWVAVFSRLFFKERLTPLKIIALLTAMAGVSLVCLSGGGTPEKADAVGIAAGLIAGLAYSMHYIYGAIYLKKFSAITIYAFCLSVGSLLLFPFVSFSPKSLFTWAILACIGIITSYAAYTAYCAGLKRLAPTKVSILCNLEPLLTTILAFAFWGELFPAIGWIGSIMVLAAIFMIMKDRD